MNRFLHRQELLANISSVERLLDRIPSNDPAGRLNLEDHLESLKAELAKIDRDFNNLGSIALFFGGEPVFGARAIDAGFAARSLQRYQDIVSRCVATRVRGNLPERGRVPHSDLSKLAITNVVHGSFGFVLEEMDDSGQALFSSLLKEVILQITDYINTISFETEANFEKFVENIDARTFLGLKNLFHIWFNEGATAVLVDNERRIELNKLDVERAYHRVGQSNIVEEEVEMHGKILGMLPFSRTFEFLRDDEKLIKGKIAQDISDEYLEHIESYTTQIGKLARIRVRERIIERQGQAAQESYALLELLDIEERES